MRRPLWLPILGLAAGMAAAQGRPPAVAAIVPAALPPRIEVPSRTVAPVADGSFRICFNYGCLAERDVAVAGAELDAIRRRLAAAPDAAGEREALAQAVGALLAVAGRQTPVAADRAGNFLDGGEDGRMDCIDHSTSATRILQLLEARGWLRFHRVLEPARRMRLIMQHFGAVIEETAARGPADAPPPAVPDHVPLLLALCDCAEVLDDIERPAAPAAADGAQAGGRYVVDSWFVDNGEAAVVLPLAEWLDGGGPNVQ